MPGTTYWAQLLHFYQPPTQTHEVLRRVAEESYRPLLRVLREHPAAHLAVNINGVLTEMLEEHGLGDVVRGLAELGQRGQLEFLGSGKYHPILPLIPHSDRVRSIADNARSNHRLLGDAWQPRGFFPPEMCFSAEIVPAIAEARHEWLVLSGVSCPAEWPTDVIYRVPANGGTMQVLFRDDVRSNRISFRETNPQHFVDDLGRVGAGKQAYVLTAMDAETYGHHIRGWEREFLAATYEAIAARTKLRASERGTTVAMITASELSGHFPDGPVIEPLPSSWSTTRDDIAAHNPYPLWQAPGNALHAMQWEYITHCRELLAIARRYAEGAEAKRYLQLADQVYQPAMHSCQFWWASRRPMWDPTLVHRGFLLLNEAALNALKAVNLGTASTRVKRQAAWTMAAANETRREIERELFEAPPR